MTVKHSSRASLYQYERGEPHALDKVFDEKGTLTCERCGACVCDHNPISPADMPIRDLEWEVRGPVRIYLPESYSSHPSVSGCVSEYVEKHITTLTTNFTLVLTQPEE